MNNKKSIYPWVVVGLLWLVALLNYMDRQMLSTMRDSMMVDIHELESAANFGRLMAIFLWIYGIMSPISGMVADKLSKKWLIVGSLAVWSSVTFLMGYTTNFTQLYILRGIMGVSEALYLPAALALIAEYHTKSRSLAVGIHMTGLYIGQALGGFGATLAVIYSWHTTFHWFGILGVAYSFILAVFLKDFKHGIEPEQSVINRPKDKKMAFKGIAMLLSKYILLDYFIVFLRTKSAGMGDKKLVADIVFRQPVYRYVSCRPHVDYYYSVFLLRWSYIRRFPIRQMDSEKYTRAHLYQCHRSGAIDSFIGFDRQRAHHCSGDGRCHLFRIGLGNVRC